MPIKRAAIKALKKAKIRATRNKAVKEGLAYLRRSVRQALESKELKKAEELVKSTVKSIDKAVQKGVLKKNTGARLKSRLVRKFNALMNK